MTAVRRVTDAERRARLVRRHGLAEPLDGPLEVARALVALHATEAPSVHLSVAARADVARDDVEKALYADRSIVKQLAMRRTLWAFPREHLAAVWGSAAARVARQQHDQLVREVERGGLTTDGRRWIAEVFAEVVATLERGGPLTTTQVRKAVPELQRTIELQPGSKWSREVPVAGRVLTTLAATGRVLRAENDGRWTQNRYRWTTASDWLGHVPDPLPETDGYAALVREWLRAFGPGTERDLVWWFGATKSAIRRALAEVEAVEVELEGPGEADTGVRTGYLLPDDLDEEPAVGPVAALLPAMDPSTMGWKDRDFYVGDHTAAVYDVNGNAIPTAWWDGRIVGGWAQRDDGTVVVVPAERLPRPATRALAEAAERLTAWLDGEVVLSPYQTDLVRAADVRR